MEEKTMERIYLGLRKNKYVDLTSLLREDQKEYIDSEGESPDRQVTRVVMEISGITDPVITVNKYTQTKLVESHFYYLDQKKQLKELLHNWLNL